MQTSQAIKEFIASRGSLRPKSLRAYLQHLRAFERAFPELPQEPLPVQQWLNTSDQLSEETRLTRFTVLRSFYRQIKLWHPDIEDPTRLMRSPRVRPRSMRTFSDEELWRLFSLDLTARERALLTLMLDVGPRAAECASVTWDRVMRGFVLLDGKTGERTVPISEVTYRRLQAIRNGSKHVFVGKRGPLTYE